MTEGTARNGNDSDIILADGRRKRIGTVALYARVSTDKQDETLQLPRLEQFAQMKGWKVYREYCDEASGKDPNRPGWKALMADASECRFDAIVVTKLDRIMRSLIQLNTAMSNLKTYGVSLVCLDIGVADLDSSNGRLMLNFLGSMAQWERETISERTKDALAARKARGERLGRRPRTDIDIYRAARMRLDGISWGSIAKDMGVPRTTLTDPKWRDRINELAERMRSNSEGGEPPASDALLKI